MNQELYVIHLGAVVCIVLHRIYNNLMVLRFLVEMCQCLFNVQYFSRTRSRCNSRFFKARVFVGNSLVLVLFLIRWSTELVFDELWIASTMIYCSVRTFPQDIRLWAVNFIFVWYSLECRQITYNLFLWKSLFLFVFFFFRDHSLINQSGWSLCAS